MELSSNESYNKYLKYKNKVLLIQNGGEYGYDDYPRGGYDDYPRGGYDDYPRGGRFGWYGWLPTYTRRDQVNQLAKDVLKSVFKDDRWKKDNIKRSRKLYDTNDKCETIEYSFSSYTLYILWYKEGNSEFEVFLYNDNDNTLKNSKALKVQLIVNPDLVTEVYKKYIDYILNKLIAKHHVYTNILELKTKLDKSVEDYINKLNFQRGSKYFEKEWITLINNITIQKDNIVKKCNMTTNHNTQRECDEVLSNVMEITVEYLNDKNREIYIRYKEKRKEEDERYNREREERIKKIDEEDRQRTAEWETSYYGPPLSYEEKNAKRKAEINDRYYGPEYLEDRRRRLEEAERKNKAAIDFNDSYYRGGYGRYINYPDSMYGGTLEKK